MGNAVLMEIDPTTGLPSALELEDADTWNNPIGEDQLVTAIQAIIEAGYEGVKIRVVGRTSKGKFIWKMSYREDTPEGRLAKGLPMLAKYGCKKIDPDQCLQTLERVYLEQGLKPPKKRESQESRR
jgi:hypothetical protein